ncbi:MAG: hypothetical protein ACXVCY_00150 [Pseudobdellovibrionaceae bacterium]
MNPLNRRVHRLHFLFQVIFFLAVSIFSSSVWSQTSEKARLSGFNEHNKEQEQFDTARAKGERAHLEEEEQWENQKNRTLHEYKKTKKKAEISDDGPEAKADDAEKKKFAEAYSKNKQDYLKEKSKQEKVVREDAHLPSEAQELGLEVTRPRYNYRKRPLYGARQKYGKMPGASSNGSSGSSSGGSPYSGNSGSTFPPPPTFDDFGDGGYIPAPNMPDDFGDVPPPPPPSSFGNDFGGSDSFPPPPPPPPPPFGGDF